ncbi:naphthalene 1,2-dioxygenase [Cupriavidus sp. USMAHM13]|uniref:FAD-binding oxidoreductase n=1 Tax=Cupriavidus sp. USMAHM13 TaxID=1389192 RepID=UPI0008A685AF|nr:FAD-binding oxidoreductase [Cupriavidus sp. USMAHM13]AOZ03517.1 naphthalene 1,2-dioxygenase [Cupriavidus sp. USMAHM13]
MRLTLQPLQRALEVPAGTNLLEALRAHEIPVSYSCMAGRCGTCRCRLAAGKVRVADGAGAAAEICAGQQILACQATLVEDCAVELPEIDEVVVHPARLLKATVTAIEALTHDIRRLRLRLNKPFAFSPGQYAMLQFTPQHARPYSMAVTPNPDEIEFHVRLVPGGRVTAYIAGALKVGDAVRVGGPLGTAYLRRKTTGPILCVAGGTGLAPVLSILRGMAEAGMDNDVHVYFGARSQRDVYGQPWLQALRRELPGLACHVVVADGAPAPGDGYRGGLVTQAIDDDWPALPGWTAYLAGAPAMVEAASALLQRKGVAPASIHADAFHASGD